MSTTSAGISRLAPSSAETDLWIRPSRGFQYGAHRGAVYGHAGAQTALTPLDTVGNLGTVVLLQAIADAGYPIAVSGLGASSPAGNGLSQVRVRQSVEWLQTTPALLTDDSTPGASNAPVVAVGISSGWASLVNHFSVYPDDVAAFVGVLCLQYLTNAYVTNPGGVRANIQTAWGVTYPTPLPAGADPSTNMASLYGKPARIYYATDDAIFTPAMAVDTVAAFGPGASSYPLGANGHTDAAIQQVDKDALVRWLADVVP